MEKILSEFSLDQNVKKVFHIAVQLAKENVNPTYGPPHIIKALLHKDVGIVPILQKINKDHYYIEEWAEVRIEGYVKTVPKGEPESDETVENLLREADDIRQRMQKEQVDAISLFAAIVTPGVAFNFDQLKSFPVKREELIDSAIDNIDISDIISNPATQNGSSNKNNNALEQYCINKTAHADSAQSDEVVGRDNELRMIAEVICRKSKPNVILAGEPGVGKTALINGFVNAIKNKNVPTLLLNAQVFELDNSALVAGASYKGEVEDRLKNILTALKKYDKPILFIDEIHSLIDKNSSATGAVNVLKPELAKGEVIIIGTTTIEDYKKHFENDEALNRRFEMIKIEEPDETVAFQMLKKVMPHYEKHHGITIPNEVNTESIRLAKRYIKDRKLPDAAIDLLDRTMAALRMLNDTGIKDIDELKQTISDWKKEETPKAGRDIDEWKWLCRSFMNKISPILSSQLSSDIDPQKIEDKKELIQYLEKTIKELNTIATKPRNELLKTDVAAIVSNKTGIPLGKLQSKEQERLLNMETILKERVVGQDFAIKAIADAILESRSGISKPGQPIGSFFFLGPTGTGKTELAKSLAEFLFQDESFMIRFDMSEFKEEHSAALLYGAPPGYVGYEEGGLLVNKIRRQPYAVVLFDEIEKAHTSVFDVFLQIMDEGKLHDKLGKTGDFSNAVVIFTSNIGSKFVVEKFNNNEIPSTTELIEIMGNHFRPEFLGRLTEIVPFAPMQQKTVRGILDIQLKGLYTALQKQGISLTISDEAKDLLALQGFTPAYGARPLSGVIRNQLRRPLSKKIISGEIKPGTKVTVTCKGDDLIWK
jgi:ATP-dependent Clp protease ATP-binding subunit ClpB